MGENVCTFLTPTRLASDGPGAALSFEGALWRRFLEKMRSARASFLFRSRPVRGKPRLDTMLEVCGRALLSLTLLDDLFEVCGDLGHDCRFSPAGGVR